ncbi:hypothetical protein SAMN06265379_101282 [Saccharicrinis carchari]|uniref:Uncharacterized protein n=1 Tax=Saccharicrinis carchari TaxID=1168039 RepID=A0A521ANT6_SACCC|nr:hypothetical protein SAMN06265379_101282 [Saccharicrinis carchari]
MATALRVMHNASHKPMKWVFSFMVRGNLLFLFYNFGWIPGAIQTDVFFKYNKAKNISHERQARYLCKVHRGTFN